ncbi:MAG: alkaline phosphatase family protein [Nocardioides sp.]
MSEFVSVDGDAPSLTGVLPAVGRALGSDAVPDPGWELPTAPAYVVLLVDGLGSRLLAANADCAPFLSAMRSVAPHALCAVPSTTATSLTSLGTGLTAGGHGIVGYSMRIPGTDRLLHALNWDKSVDPLRWQPHATIFQRLAADGIAATTVSKREFDGSGLTVASQRGALFVGADRWGERVEAVVTASARRPALTYVYEGDLDWIGHRYGIDSPQWRHQLTAIDAAMAQLRDALPPAVRLLVVADHGMIDCPPGERIDVDEVPDLRAGVRLLGGEARLRHVYCLRGALDDVAAHWREILGERAAVLTRSEVRRAGWFGPVADQVGDRIGDLVVACRGRFGVFSSRSFAGETKLVGVHGSLTPDEMQVPLLLG